MEKKKKEKKIGVHSSSNVVGRWSGVNAFGPSGAMSASAVCTFKLLLFCNNCSLSFIILLLENEQPDIRIRYHFSL